MTTPEGRAMLSRSPKRSSDQNQPYQAGPVWMQWLPPAAMLAAGLWGVTGASYWRDEAATLTAVRRPFTQLVRMLGHIDAVHGAYYLVMWPVVRLAGPGELATRLPSVLAMTVAAAIVAALGRRLATPHTGLAAGLLFVILPQVSRYAQEARPYAIVTALAVTASYLLVRSAGAGSGSGRRAWLAWYALCVGVLGAMEIFALLLIGAHAVTIALLWLHERSRDQLRLAAEWAVAAVIAVALATPALIYGYLQKDTLSWLVRKPQGLKALAAAWRLVGPPHLVQAACAVSLIGLVLSLLAGWPQRLLEFSVPWVVLPPLALIGVSFLTPVYTPRYVVYCLPAVALVTGAALAALCHAAGGKRSAVAGPALALGQDTMLAENTVPAGDSAPAGDGRQAQRDAEQPGDAPAPDDRSAGAGQRTSQRRPVSRAGARLTWLGWLTGLAGLVLITLPGIGAQAVLRSPDGHGDNIRRMDMIIAANRQPGDALVEIDYDAERFGAAYPYGMAQLDNIAQAMTPSAAANLAGTLLPVPQIRQRLSHVRRVWLVSASGFPSLSIVHGLDLRRHWTWRVGRIWLVLYRHRYR